MKKIVFTIVMFSLIGVFALVTTAMAEGLGAPLHKCWNLAPFIDNIELAVTNEGGGIFALHGVWRAPGYYSHACDGAVAPDPVAGDRDLELFCSDKLDDPWKNGIFFHAKLKPDLTGYWILHIESDGFQNTGTLVPIPCPIPLSGGKSGSPAIPVK